MHPLKVFHTDRHIDRRVRLLKNTLAYYNIIMSFSNENIKNFLTSQSIPHRQTG
jgi:hypothetical protein